MSLGTVGIIGTGLIGGSVGLRARQSGARTIGYDTDERALAGAVTAGAIAERASRDDVYAQAETVVIATHLEGTLEELRRLRSQGAVAAGLILDVASVKSPVCASAGSLPGFVATHPMAGSERSGAVAARADLFQGRTWAYVPTGEAQLDGKARAFIEILGGVPFAVAADEHDRIVAFTSHLPQMAGWAYAGLARVRASERFDRLIGATARELLRVGASEPTMWRDVVAANRARIAADLRALGSALLERAERLDRGDVDGTLGP